MSGIFVDTGAWFALFVPTDPNHGAAHRWYDQNHQTLLTTDYIVDETLTLLKARGEFTRAFAVGRQFFNDSLASVHYLSQEEIRLTWQTFQNFSDKAWSFTDCSSKIVIEKFGLSHAFAFDQHFQQFGTVTIVP